MLTAIMRQQGGSLAMSFALLLPMILGVIGLCADYMSLVLIRTELQSAADGAAINGARKMTLTGAKKKDIDAGVGAYLNEAVDRRNGDYGFETGVDLKAFTVHVTLSQRWTPFFAHVFSDAVTPVSVKAEARLMGTTNVCLLALHPSTAAAVHLTMLAKVEARDCAIYANSKDFAAIRLDLLGKLQAGLICSAGGTFGLLSHFSPEPTSDCPVLKDPLADLPAPGDGSCDHNDVTVIKDAVTLPPGVYCGGLTIKGSADVRFAPGTYVIRGGAFTVSGKAKIQSQDTGFYLQGDKAVIDFSGSTTIDLSGQENGPMAGLLFFEDRAAPADRTHLINSANARRLTGTIYLPRGKLLINPNAPVAPDSAYTAIVARRVALTDGPTLILNSDYDLSPVPVPDGIRASSRVVLSE